LGKTTLEKIVIRSGQTLWFFSDPHYGHKNICYGVSSWEDKSFTRPYSTVDEMNDAIVNGINSLVKEDDILICLGDWAFGGFKNIGEFRARLNVLELRILPGNHDYHIINDKDGVRSVFSHVYDQNIVNLQVSDENDLIPKTNLVLSHYPIASWENMNRGWLHLHGHVHLPPAQKTAIGKHLDVGMDGNFMAPYSIFNIISMLEPKRIKHLTLPKDHHEDTSSGNTNKPTK
jgi:calcineurin-like phosphoesterase family protein